MHAYFLLSLPRLHPELASLPEGCRTLWPGLPRNNGINHPHTHIHEIGYIQRQHQHQHHLRKPAGLLLSGNSTRPDPL